MSAHPSKAPGGSPPASSAAGQRIPSPWSALDAAKLREVLARTAKVKQPLATMTALDFGRYVRRKVDATPETTAGFLAMQKFLRVDPVCREIDQLKTQMDATHRETNDLRNQVHQLQSQPPKAKRRPTGKPDSKAVRGKKRLKEVTRKEAGEKVRARVNAIMVRMSKKGHTEGEIERELIEKVYRLYDYEHAKVCGYSEKAAKTFSRIPEYGDWARYRVRGNAAKLDPASPAVEFTSAGGKSSKSGKDRNVEFVGKNKLGIGQTRKMPELDAEARQKIADDPEASEWYERNRAKLEEPPGSEEFVDYP